MIKYQIHKTETKTLTQRDAEFYIQEKFTLVPRAALQIDQTCPGEYRQIIAACIDRGWLRPVANIRDYEYTYELIKA